MSYAVKECFLTLQGEGLNVGRPALFLRLAGCNLWSGRHEDRARDLARSGAPCPGWCDTDFVGGRKLTAAQVARAMDDELEGHPPPGLVVITGGEPLLQLDDELLWHVRQFGEVAVETNGTVEPRWTGQGPDHVTVSPKRLPPLAVPRIDELRVPFPDLDPLAFDGVSAGHRFVSPVAVGPGIAARDVMSRAAEFCMLHPRWRLSLQTHKVTGLR